MSTTHRRDYDELGLGEAADWNDARVAYRSLVNTWHPDRYARRPREREHAQQRFIRLTQSFNRLRSFYRENGRLPFEKVVPPAPERLRVDRVARDRTEQLRRDASTVAIKAELSGDELQGGDGRARASTRPRRPAMLWVGIGAGVVAGTMALVGVMDRNERLETYQGGREVLLDTVPSEFMPSATEVRRQSTRGSFVTRQDGELGDQLMEDIFQRPIQRP